MMVASEVKIAEHDHLDQPSKFPEYYCSRSVFILSMFHLIVAMYLIALGVADLFTVKHPASIIACPIWGGVLFCVTSGLGIGSYWNRTRCLIGTFAGFSCFSVLLSAAMLGWHLLPVIGHFIVVVGKNNDHDEHRPKLMLGLGFSTATAILFLAELSISIASTVYSLQPFVKCCRRKQYSSHPRSLKQVFRTGDGDQGSSVESPSFDIDDEKDTGRETEIDRTA